MSSKKEISRLPYDFSEVMNSKVLNYVSSPKYGISSQDQEKVVRLVQDMCAEVSNLMGIVAEKSVIEFEKEIREESDKEKKSFFT